jgi:hypothetical protein
VKAALDRYPFNSPWVRQVIGRSWLGLWFALVSVPGVVVAIRNQPLWFFDSHLYLAATRAWLAGANPWDVKDHGLYFAAPPPTLVPFVPFVLLPEPIATILVGALCIAGGILTLRMLRLPAWWLLFPPLLLGALSGNVQLLLMPLLLGRGSWVAPILKIYAAVPLAILGRWRSLFMLAVVLLATAPVLPWPMYLKSIGATNAVLASQSHYGPTLEMTLLLLPLGVVCLVIVGRERAAWLAVPALWPAQQWYYATLVLPTRSRLIAALVAVPVPLSGFLALFAAALLRLRAMAVARRQLPAPGSNDVIEVSGP